MVGLSELSDEFIGNIMQFADVEEFYQLERVSHQWQRVMASYFPVEKELMGNEADYQPTLNLLLE
ncbi:hypothetical protein PNK_0382 [Candidatus Protochlamydia naegleriophila]|uniref:F-box domain-containing protein n=1 Tax=Candidatus Protochlamydia naegleriophila TaxID=389348 RepID=A0A0U5EPN1_9BACT|nr:F-box protein [Candidatus Protochlamydia naegleriophila]CUI16016.1 hypothetical protein PNK_0382 [Candidatus Protochlamydia naegleriophila]